MRLKLSWDRDKNDQLKARRDIGFDDINKAIERDQMLTDMRHSNQEKYPGQRMMIVNVNNYAYAVPYVIQADGTLFLKTIYPSRKHTKKYLNSRNDD